MIPRILKTQSSAAKAWGFSITVAGLGLLNCRSQRLPAPQRTYSQVNEFIQEMGKLPYAAVAAKTSERLAVDKTLTEKAKRTVHIVSNPNLAVGPVTKYSDRIAPTRRIPAIRILSAPTAFEIRVSGR